MQRTIDNSKLRIAFVGGTGFPYSIGADINRLGLLAKGLTENNCWVLVINRRGHKLNKQIPVSGHVNNFLFTHSSGYSIRPHNFFKRNIFKILGATNEILILKKKKINAVIISSRSFWLVLNYWFWGRIIGFKLFLNYVELNTTKINKRRSLLRIINDVLFLKYVFRFLHGIFPISEVLKDVALKGNPGLPCLKIPVLVDFKEFDIRKSNPQHYFLYCGQSYYIYAIELIIKAFELISDQTICLKLVLSGDIRYIGKIKLLINNSKNKNRIEILSGLLYKELVKLFVNATGLLIPLKPFPKDQARFPHKIGEYTAAGRPIITTNFGEIKNYFIDMHNALIADYFEPESFAKKMDYVINNAKHATAIGKNGKLTGLQNFDYNTYGSLICNFIKKIVSRT